MGEITVRTWIDAPPEVCFEGRHFGMRQRFCARITHVDRPHVFVDEMVEGFFRELRHAHWFSPSDRGTLMTDHLEWRAPLGRLMDALFMTRHMRWFVKTKQERMKAIVERQYRSFFSGGSESNVPRSSQRRACASRPRRAASGVV